MNLKGNIKLLRQGFSHINDITVKALA